MYKRKTKANKIKILIILILIFVLVKICQYTFALFQSKSNTTANIDVAYYILNEDYKDMTLNLGRILPRDDPYVYTFSIANNNRFRKNGDKSNV